MLETGPGVEEGVVEENEEELRKALALSTQDMEVEDEEADLRRAIQLSMQGKAILGKQQLQNHPEYHTQNRFMIHFLI